MEALVSALKGTAVPKVFVCKTKVSPEFGLTTIRYDDGSSAPVPCNIWESCRLASGTVPYDVRVFIGVGLKGYVATVLAHIIASTRNAKMYAISIEDSDSREPPLSVQLLEKISHNVETIHITLSTGTSCRCTSKRKRIIQHLSNYKLPAENERILQKVMKAST